MNILDYQLDPSVNEIMAARGIKNVDIQRLLGSEKANHFVNENGTFGIIRGLLGITTYYVEYEIRNGQKIITDSYCHMISLTSDRR